MLVEPKITTALSVNEGRTTLTVMRNDGKGIISRVHIDLAEAEREGYLALVQRVGEATLRLLNAAQPDLFARYPQLIPPAPAEETLTMAHVLIHRSVREKTLAYVSAIDALLASGDSQVASTDIAEHWAEIRISLIEQYGGRS